MFVYTHSLKLSTAPAFIRRVLYTHTYISRRWVTWIGKHTVNTPRQSYFILLNITIKCLPTKKVKSPLFWAKPAQLTRKVKDLQSFWQMFPHWFVFFMCTCSNAVRMFSWSSPPGGWNRTWAFYFPNKNKLQCEGCSLYLYFILKINHGLTIVTIVLTGFV